MVFRKKKVFVVPSKSSIVKRRVRKSRLPKDKVLTEVKWFDQYYSSVNASTTGTIILLNGTGQGLNVNARIANRIHLKKTHLKYFIGDNGVPVTDSIVRVMVVYDREADGALPSVFGGQTTNSILDNTSVASSLSFQNPNNRDRYTILYDKSTEMVHNALQAVSGTTSIALPRWKNKSKMIPLDSFTQYNASGAGVTEINSGALYLVVMSNIISGSNAPIMTFNNRLYFTDG